MKPTKEVILMKQLIVFIVLTILGIAVYTILMGSQEDSVYMTVRNLWIQEVEDQKITLK